MLELLLVVCIIVAMRWAWRAREEARLARGLAEQQQHELVLLRQAVGRLQAAITADPGAQAFQPASHAAARHGLHPPAAPRKPGSEAAHQAVPETLPEAGPDAVDQAAPPQEQLSTPEPTPAAQPDDWQQYREFEPAASAAAPAAGPAIHGQPWSGPPPPAWLPDAKAWLFGGNLVAKLGLLILFIGVSFLLRYTAARISVPIELRLAAVVLVDLAVLAWAWRIRTRRPAISLPVQGTALAVLMLVTFGALRIYHLLPGSLAFALLLVLTVFTCLLAVLQDAKWLAVFGIAGGYAAPILASSGGGSHVMLFSYYAVLNGGVFAIALLRSWRILNLIGFAFTFTIATAWGVLSYQTEHYLSAQLFLILFFLYYVGISLAYAQGLPVRLRHHADGTLVFGTPMLAFGLQFGLVHNHPFGVAYSALALGLFYIVLASMLRRRARFALPVSAFIALGIVFGTLAIPFALDARWTSAAWALEGAGIVWVGLRQRRRLAWVFGLLLQGGAWISLAGALLDQTSISSLETWLWTLFTLLAIPPLLLAHRARTEGGRGFVAWLILALVPCGLALVTVEGGAWRLPIHTLLDQPILGAAMILAGAAFTSWTMQRHADIAPPWLARLMLGWSAWWWYALIAPLLAAWLGTRYWTTSHYEKLGPGLACYLLLVAASAPLLLWAARRLAWPQLRWTALPCWIALAGASIAMLDRLYGYGPPPGALLWISYAALWLASEWLLHNWPQLSGAALRAIHTLRSAAPWLMLWPVAQRAIAGWLGDGVSAEALASPDWRADASWARFLPAWLMMAAAAWLIRRTRNVGWPVAPIASWYRRVLVPAACAWSLLLIGVWNLTQDGAMAPLPYLPLANPLDLSCAFALLLAASAWRLWREDADAPAVPWAPLAGAVLAYAWFNLALLRAVSHYLGIPYEARPMFDAQFVQAMLSLVWSVTALLLMQRAARRALRPAWIGGAVLLGLAVAKLFLVDLSNIGGVERIVSFVGVGALMVGIGYVAPYPSQTREEQA